MSIFEISEIGAKAIFCVYEHEVGGVVFYVGSGPFSRAFELGGSRRTNTWREFRRDQPLTVRILSIHADRNAARKAEYAAIRIKRPYANITGGFSPFFEQERGPAPQLTANPTKRVVYCPTDGTHYDTVKAAAAHYGVTSGAISNAIRGRYPTVRGHEFRWAFA